MGIKLYERSAYQKTVEEAQKKFEEGQRALARAFALAPEYCEGLYSDEIETMRSDTADALAVVNSSLKNLAAGKMIQDGK